ncbi:MAG: hydantoinase/oxoprolinase family protein [Pseudomonadota bacterium]
MTTDPTSVTGLRVAFDIGGTFADVVVAIDGAVGPAGRAGALWRFKILTLPESIGEDVGACIDEAVAGAGAGDVSAIVHGTTVAANTVLEHRGAVTGVITTAGFRDELEIRRLARPGVYNVFWERNAPLVPRRLRLEVSERLRVDGSVDAPLDEAAVTQAATRLADAEIEALAIVFLHAYVNPAHERRARELARAVVGDIPICISAEVLPEVREYERASTTALNAYLTPVVTRYLSRLERALERFGQPLRIMQSNGGVMSAKRTRERPVNMIESGPAAGVLAAAAMARALKLEQVVSFDMGGTTAKACLIEGGVPIETAEGEVGAGINLTSRLSKGDGYALRVPAFDLAEVGAGGGSIAWVDDGGALRVGPQSAGAEPGPAAYGRGGNCPTITDANVLLGYMSPHAIAGGTVPIDRAAAAAVYAELQSQLELDERGIAYGVHQVGNATMARAIRAVTTERGRDPREFDLIAFGGNGAIHALSLAESLGISRVLIPLHPGLFSALGLLLADERYDFVQSVPAPLAELGEPGLDAAFAALTDRAWRESGLPPGTAVVERLVDLRYARQSSELTLSLDGLPVPGLVPALANAFHAEHERTYGYCLDREAVGVVSVRIRLGRAAATPGFEALGHAFAELEGIGNDGATRDAYFGPAHGVRSAALCSRQALRGAGRSGPLIVDEFDTAVVVPPGWHARTDSLGVIHLEREGT